MSRRRIAAVALATALAFALPSHADDRLRIDLRGDDGGRLNLEFPGSWARAFLNAVDAVCERADDVRLFRAVRALDREGDVGSVRFVDRDGDRVQATRDEDVLRLVVFDPDDDAEAEIEMPWSAAECWILGREPEGDVAFGRLADDFRFELVSDDARIHISVD